MIVGTYLFSQMPTVVAKLVKDVQEGVDEAVKLIVEDGVNKMADSTPVDTTRAVSNWIVTIGSPASGEVPPHVPGSKGGTGAPAARAATKGRAKAAVSGLRGAKAVYITNNVPYIGVLEYGDAKHRPSGMVSKGLQAMGVRASSIQIVKT